MRRMPTMMNTPPKTSTMPTKGAVTAGIGMPILMNRPTPSSSGNRNFCSPSVTKTAPTTNRSRTVARGARDSNAQLTDYLLCGTRQSFKNSSRVIARQASAVRRHRSSSLTIHREPGCASRARHEGQRVGPRGVCGTCRSAGCRRLSTQSSVALRAWNNGFIQSPEHDG